VSCGLCLLISGKRDKAQGNQKRIFFYLGVRVMTEDQTEYRIEDEAPHDYFAMIPNLVDEMISVLTHIDCMDTSNG
jgi:hypothetical protein